MNISLTIILAVMTGIISYQAFNNASMKAKLMFRPASVNEFGEWYRFFTHGFVHADFSHLFINLYVLWIFGEYVEKQFMYIFGDLQGRVFFLLVYIGAIIVGAVPSYFKHKNNGYYAALGASGGTSGIVFAFIIFNPWGWFIFPPLPGVLMAIGYVMYSSYMSKKGGDNIGHDAHLWGALFGFVVTLLLILLFRPEFMEVVIAGFKDLSRLKAGPF